MVFSFCFSSLGLFYCRRKLHLLNAFHWIPTEKTAKVTEIRVARASASGVFRLRPLEAATRSASRSASRVAATIDAA
jgi:hypothetical protein